MKGTNWNGNGFATKGRCSSRGSYMFSVGGIVAFEAIIRSSPDGRSYTYGCIPSQGNYLLQEEIILEEYNNTKSDRYGSGAYDVREIVDLPDVCWHEHRNQLRTKKFLLQVLDTDKNIFTDGFIGGDIAEVRNHPGKFLHIYEIPEEYHECKDEDAINLQKKQEDNLRSEEAAKRYRGFELVFGITTNDYYPSSASFGGHSAQLQHEYDSTRRGCHKIMIMPCVPDGGYQFYVRSIPISLYLEEGREPSIDTMTDHHWANRQSWWHCKIETLSIQEGWIFVDGEDVFESTKAHIDEFLDEKRGARKAKFEELSKVVIKKHGKEVLKLALSKKGSVLAILKALSESTVQVRLAELEKIFRLSSSAPVIENLMACVANKVNAFKAAKIAEKAYAWAYIHNALPGVPFTGYFNDAKEALEIYAKNWSTTHI